MNWFSSVERGPRKGGGRIFIYPGNGLTPGSVKLLFGDSSENGGLGLFLRQNNIKDKQLLQP